MRARHMHCSRLAVGRLAEVVERVSNNNFAVAWVTSLLSIRHAKDSEREIRPSPQAKYLLTASEETRARLHLDTGRAPQRRLGVPPTVGSSHVRGSHGEIGMQGTEGCQTLTTKGHLKDTGRAPRRRVPPRVVSSHVR